MHRKYIYTNVIENVKQENMRLLKSCTYGKCISKALDYIAIEL